jgi:uncharacterized protein YecE (DUF72 family)
MKAIAKVEESLMENADIRIGTCGFSYAEWREVFYPKDLRQSEFLRFYSLVFPFVELDFSWSTMPKAEQLLAMTEQTPPDFLFCLKAHRSLSHEIGKDWGESAERFSSAAQVLSGKRQLAAILIQLPFRFSYTAENRVYLGDLISALDGFPLVVEFRNEFWYQQRVFDELAKRKVCLAIIDRPELPGLPPESQSSPATVSTTGCMDATAPSGGTGMPHPATITSTLPRNSKTGRACSRPFRGRRNRFSWPLTITLKPRR